MDTTPRGTCFVSPCCARQPGLTLKPIRATSIFLTRSIPMPEPGSKALTVRQGYDFNYRLAAMQVSPHAGKLPGSFHFLDVDQDNVVVTAMKKTEDGDGLLVRFYEWAGKGGNVTLTLPPGILSATLANLMEKPEGSPLPVVGGQKVTVPVTPFEIQTVGDSLSSA